MYFSFTSLSTVGFGDMTPNTNAQRAACCAVLMFGVSIFSYILGIFGEMIGKLRGFNDDESDSERLDQFFSLMKKFNGGRNIKKSLRTKIEEYFDMKLVCYRNKGLTEEVDLNIFWQLPDYT